MNMNGVGDADLHLSPEDMETTEQREEATESLAEVCRILVEKHGKFITEPKKEDELINFRKMEFTDKGSGERLNIMKVEAPISEGPEEYPNDYIIKFFPKNSTSRTVYSIESGRTTDEREIDENNVESLPKKLSALKTKQLQERLEHLAGKNNLL